MTSEGSFVFLDSSFSVSQSVQLRLIRLFADENMLAIDFYGSELLGTESSHKILKDYVRERRSRRFIFFSLTQFVDENGLQVELLRSMVRSGIKIGFAAQGIVDLSESELNEMSLIAYSLIRRSERPVVL